MRWWPGSSRVLLAGLTLATPLSACADSGCDNFDPQSEPLPVGSSVTVDVDVADGGLTSFVDVNGGYYKQPYTSVRLEQGGTNSLPSPYLSATGDRSATVLSTSRGLLMTVAGESFLLDGPLGCE
jgi:hypothetical protein